jgi:hypothetical protein
MMDYNRAPEREVALNETGLENGKDINQLSDDNGTLNRRFGVTDLWSMRRNARKFKIHDRIPRL